MESWFFFGVVGKVGRGYRGCRNRVRGKRLISKGKKSGRVGRAFIFVKSNFKDFFIESRVIEMVEVEEEDSGVDDNDNVLFSMFR